MVKSYHSDGNIYITATRICMIIFGGFETKSIKNCQEFIYSWKVSKIQHVICPYNERNFFTFYLILINSPTDGITLQLFSIR